MVTAPGPCTDWNTAANTSGLSSVALRAVLRSPSRTFSGRSVQGSRAGAGVRET